MSLWTSGLHLSPVLITALLWKGVASPPHPDSDLLSPSLPQPRPYIYLS
jgi:hypothetical protein